MSIIIDGDEIAYKAAAITRTKVDWGDGEEQIADIPAAIRAVDSFIEEAQVATGYGRCDFCIAISDTHNFRKDLYPAYKTQRKSPKPAGYLEVLQYLQEMYTCDIFKTCEGDDVMGVLAMEHGYTICSSDKDMLTIPGVPIYSFFKGSRAEDPHIPAQSQFEADRFWLIQSLMGDATDGYPGIPKVGIKKAERILQGCSTTDEMLQAVVDAYAERGLTRDDALVQMRLARILRGGEYCYSDRMPVLFELPRSIR